jgi:alpha-tubulin suppressor-like RCC1 family protein
LCGLVTAGGGSAFGATQTSGPRESASPRILTGVKGLTSGTDSACSLLTSGGVECWGYGYSGQLGDGMYYTKGDHLGSDLPVHVVGVGRAGDLGDVTGLASTGNGYCARLTSGGVDCWGYGYHGELGDGHFATSPTPQRVEGLGGKGTLGGVVALASDGADSYCAVSTSSGVDCWGVGVYGELGDGIFYTSGHGGSDAPVQAEGVGGTGTLTGVISITSNSPDSYCAMLSSGGVDCWGDGALGQLGDGSQADSAVPVQVDGMGGTGALGGVTSIASDGANSLSRGSGNGYCVVLRSGGVDCWGDGIYGQLGNGRFYTTDYVGSDVPVQVKGVGGKGALTDVTSLSTGVDYTFCAVLTSTAVDCWGFDYAGELGNGEFDTFGGKGSAVPVHVEGVGGTGTLSGVVSLTGTVGGVCALLTTGRIDCWGGTVLAPVSVPTQVEPAGVASLSTPNAGSLGGACVLLKSSGVDCWGFGKYGQLGDGSFANSATPVDVG